MSENREFSLKGTHFATCKYGENAWQTPAYVYSTGSNDPLSLDKFQVIEGTPPGSNNWNDTDRLLQTITHINEVYTINEGLRKIPIAIGVKHGNACGAAVNLDQEEAFKKMAQGDPLAIFGGLVMTNFAVNETMCESLGKTKLDGIIAPSFTPGAIALLRRKEDKCRFIINEALGEKLTLDQAPRFRYIRGGFVIQPNYTFVPNFKDGQITKHTQATIEQETDMMLAWAIGSTSNSNTITLVKNEQLIGNGVGQQDRVGAAKLAIERAHRSGHEIKGAAAYSDSFFPFQDGVQALIDAGVKAIFTSSGSRNDPKIIDLCQAWGVILYMIPDVEGRGFFGH